MGRRCVFVMLAGFWGFAFLSSSIAGAGELRDRFARDLQTAQWLILEASEDAPLASRHIAVLVQRSQGLIDALLQHQPHCSNHLNMVRQQLEFALELDQDGLYQNWVQAGWFPECATSCLRISSLLRWPSAALVLASFPGNSDWPEQASDLLQLTEQSLADLP